MYVPLDRNAQGDGYTHVLQHALGGGHREVGAVEHQLAYGDRPDRDLSDRDRLKARLLQGCSVL